MSVYYGKRRTRPKMEFPFNVNRLFKKRITKVQSDLVPEGVVDVGVVGKSCADNVAKVVDSLGVASAESQNLFRPVTSADRLRKSDHLLYVLTDQESNGKNGAVVGFLKTGYKNLYLFDKSSRNHETKPLCVLDFYIHESMQRKGLGRELFDYMLKDVNIAPKYLAMDKPSDSFMRFVKKHYGLFKTIPQAINYVIYDDFFTKRPDGKLQYPSRVHGRVPLSEVRGPRKRSSAPAVAAPALPPPTSAPPAPSPDHHGRFSATRPPSTVAECFSYAHVDPSLAPHLFVPSGVGDGPQSGTEDVDVAKPQSPGCQMNTMQGGGMAAGGAGSPMGMPGSPMMTMVPGTPEGQMMEGSSPVPSMGVQNSCSPGMQIPQIPGTPQQMMPGTPVQGVSMQNMQGMQMNMQGIPMQGMAMQGMPMQGMSMQSLPVPTAQGAQGMPTPGTPVQGSQGVHGMTASQLVAAGDGASMEAAGMPVCKSGPRSYESMRKTHYTHTPLW